MRLGRSIKMNAVGTLKSTLKYVYMHLRVILVIASIMSNELCVCYPAIIQFKNSLYHESDEVQVISGNNTLTTTLYGSQQAWFVQFYSSWCGHCVQFAPTWKGFAEDIRGWKTVAKVAAMNCADEINSKTCSQYIDIGFPTLRLFSALQKNGTGDLSKGPRDIVMLRRALIDHVVKQENPRPSHWPLLTPVGTTWVSDYLAKKHNPSVQVVAVVMEDDNSYTGKELILDMSSRREVLIVSVRPEQQMTRDSPAWKWKAGGLPALFIVKGNQQPKEIASFGSRESFYTALQAYLNKIIINTNEDEQDVRVENLMEPVDDQVNVKDVKVELISTKLPKSRSVVYMQDLESAILYSLKHEIILQQTIQGDALDALKSYVLVLKKYFPGQASVMYVLETLHALLQPYDEWVSSGDWSKMLTQIQTLHAYGSFLNDRVAWVTCRGSTPVFRGYPCGLWILFHTLTVSHSQREDIPDSEADSKEVLRAMQGYILHFFGCRECSDNFAKESASLESSIYSRDEAIMWLWKVHNSVNGRLAGSDSEDPTHPKIQFPSAADCPLCFREKAWSEDAVLSHLKTFYDVRNMNTTGNQGVMHGENNHKLPRAEWAGSIGGRGVAVETRPLGINNTDISICLFLYALCSVILLGICAYMKRFRKCPRHCVF